MMKFFIQLFTVVVMLTSSVSLAEVRYKHTDMLGSVVAESDEQGNIISRSHYEPFGQRIGGDKEGIGYTGHLQDTDLGLTYMQARYYDPVIGRFYSNDPVGYIGNPHSFNRYAYVNNNPYKYTDPTGELAFLAWLVTPPGAAAVAAAAQVVVDAAAITLGIGMIAEAIDDAPDSESSNKGSANDKSKSKRRAKRKAKRSHGTPTSKPGNNQQGRPGTPRHEVVEGSGGQPVGVVDGSNDTVDGHGDHVEVGNIKTAEPTNKHGQPRIRQPKAKEDF